MAPPSKSVYKWSTLDLSSLLLSLAEDILEVNFSPPPLSFSPCVHREKIRGRPFMHGFFFFPVFLQRAFSPFPFP